MGVISLTSIQSGICFGPIPTALMIADPAYLVGNMTCDTFPEIPVTRVNLHHSMEMHRLIEWVPYLRSARCPTEQNLELLRERNGEIFYRISRSVVAGEELLIWFSQEYCDQIGIPTTLPGGIEDRCKDTIPYKCEHCSDKFKYPYPFICHNMFKCRANQNPKLTIPPLTSSITTPPQASPSATLFPSNMSHKRKVSEIANEFHNGITCVTTTTTGGSEGSAFHKVPKSSPIFETPVSPPNFKQISSLSSSVGNSAMFNLQNLYLSHQLVAGNQFKNINNNNTLFFPPTYYPTSSYLQINSMAAAAAVAAEFASREAARFSATAPLSPPTLLPQPSLPPMTSSVMPPKSANPMVEKLLQSALTGESMAPNPLSSLNLTQNWCAKCNATFRMTSDLVYHMRTHHKRDDREVDVAMGGVPVSVDLPEGMAQTGTVRSKRHDHLRCDICGENFKERHHLTRHMTSHD